MKDPLTRAIEMLTDSNRSLSKRVRRLEVKNTPMQTGVPHYLGVPLTSAAWNNISLTTTATGQLLDLGVHFGAPDNVLSVLVRTRVRETNATSATNYWLALGPGQGYSLAMVSNALPSGQYNYKLEQVPCDENGNLWYSVNSSPTGVLEVHMQIWGYWL